MELRRWLLSGALVGLLVLGIGGRALMRIIALMEGRPPVLTAGSLTVLFAGTVAGTAAGLIYFLLRRFVSDPLVRTSTFIVICELVTWRGVHGLLPRPQLMFMVLSLVYLVIIDFMGRRRPVVSRTFRRIPSIERVTNQGGTRPEGSPSQMRLADLGRKVKLA